MMQTIEEIQQLWARGQVLLTKPQKSAADWQEGRVSLHHFDGGADVNVD